MLLRGLAGYRSSCRNLEDSGFQAARLGEQGGVVETGRTRSVRMGEEREVSDGRTCFERVK
jgi:hypothetical protein